VTDHELERLFRLVVVIDHLEQHGRHDEVERLGRERDALLESKRTPQAANDKRMGR
jgi:hypothetical protein